MAVSSFTSMRELGRPVRFGQQAPTAAEEKFLRRAIEISRQSKDPSTQTGSVITGADDIVLSEAYNHFPPGIDETPPDRWERPAKYDWVGHAEANAIHEAARQGIALQGSRIFTSFYPCIACAKAIISSGIQEVISFKPNFNHPRWGRDFQFVDKLFKEAKIKLRLFPENSLSPNS